jgi:uncharacterized protein (DUF1330 family)
MIRGRATFALSPPPPPHAKLGSLPRSPPMHVANAAYPTPDQAQALFKAAEDGPFVMVNLLKFKDRASDDNGAAISGREAYMRYGVAMRELVERTGGRMLFSGDVRGLMIGVVEEMWDMVALVEYPSRAAFLSITRMPEFAAIEPHRTAGLAGQLNIETKALAL